MVRRARVCILKGDAAEMPPGYRRDTAEMPPRYLREERVQVLVQPPRIGSDMRHLEQ